MKVELSAIIAGFLIIAPATFLYWDMDGDELRSYEEIFGNTESVAPLSQIKVLSFREKSEWTLETKYNIGKKKEV